MRWPAAVSAMRVTPRSAKKIGEGAEPREAAAECAEAASDHERERHLEDAHGVRDRRAGHAIESCTRR